MTGETTIASILKAKFRSRRSAILALVVLIPASIVVSLLSWEFVYNLGMCPPEEFVLSKRMENYLIVTGLGIVGAVLTFPVAFYEFWGLAKNLTIINPGPRVEVYCFINEYLAITIFWALAIFLVVYILKTRSIATFTILSLIWFISSIRWLLVSGYLAYI